MDRTGRAASHRVPCIVALLLACPIAATDSTVDPDTPPDAELLEYLGETAGMDPELVSFMESRQAKRAVKDAAKKEPGRRADPEDPAGALPPEGEGIMAEGAARWQSMSDTERAAARARFNTWRQLPPEEREWLRERWKRFRELTPGQQEAVREAYRALLELPPERREALSERWREMSAEERRRAIQRRQGTKPGTVDKRPCPPC